MAIHTAERNMPVSLRFCSRHTILAYNPGMGKKWRAPRDDADKIGKRVPRRFSVPKSVGRRMVARATHFRKCVARRPPTQDAPRGRF